MLASPKRSYDQPRQHIKKQRHYFANKGPSSPSSGVSSSHVWMWELDHKEGCAQKNQCFELWCSRRLLTVPWTARRYNQSFLKEINPESSLEGLMLKLQYFGQLVQSWLIRKDPDVRKDWRKEEKWTTEYEMIGWHRRFNGHEFEQALGDDAGQRSLPCCSLWGGKEWGMTEQLNNNN